MDRLAIYKALGDPTRFHLFDLLAAADEPKATSELAAALRLHPNTVRPHLERLREVGLLSVTADKRGAVGRPQHLWVVADDAPDLGALAPTQRDTTQATEPPSTLFAKPGPPLLAALLAELSTRVGASSQHALHAGRQRGRAMAENIGQRLNERGQETPWVSCMDRCEAGLVALTDQNGFVPEVIASDKDDCTVKFSGECPFGEIVHSFPHLTCQLHRGMIEGLVLGIGGARVRDFHDIEHPSLPCQVTLTTT